MCIYLDPAGVYIWRIYDTLETILTKMLTFRSATTNYSDKIYFQAADRSARGWRAPARCAQGRSSVQVFSREVRRLSDHPFWQKWYLYFFVVFLYHSNLLFRHDDGKEWPGVRQQERPVAWISGGELWGWRDNHGEYSVMRIFRQSQDKIRIMSSFSGMCTSLYLLCLFESSRSCWNLLHWKN